VKLKSPNRRLIHWRDPNTGINMTYASLISMELQRNVPFKLAGKSRYAKPQGNIGGLQLEGVSARKPATFNHSEVSFWSQ